MRRLTIALCPVWLITASSFAQGFDWAPRADPGGRQSAVAFSIDGTGYMGTGQASGISSTSGFKAYDPIADTWTTKASVPGGNRDEAVGFVVNGLGYIGMGLSGSFGYAKKDLWEYHPAWDAWAQKDTLPGPARYAATAFAIGDTGYVGLGTDGNNLFHDFWAFHPGTNSWEQKADFPGGARRNAFSFVIDGIAYVGAGDSSSTRHDDLWAYDAATDTWTQKASMPHPYSHTATATMNGRGYTFWGGDEMNFFQSIVYEYDPIADAWTLADASFIAWQMRRWEGFAFVINDTVYTGTGWNNLGYQNDLWSFTAGLSTGIQSEQEDELIDISVNGSVLDLVALQALDDALVQLVSVSGEVLMVRRITSHKGGSRSLVLPDPSPGLYLLRVDLKDRHAVRKFTVFP